MPIVSSCVGHLNGLCIYLDRKTGHKFLKQIIHALITCVAFPFRGCTLLHVTEAANQILIKILYQNRVNIRITQ